MFRKFRNPFRKRWHVDVLGVETGTTYELSVCRFHRYESADDWIRLNAAPVLRSGLHVSGNHETLSVVTEPTRYVVAER